MSFLSYRLTEKLIKLEQKTFEKSGNSNDIALFISIFLFACKTLLRGVFARRPKANCLNIGFVLSGGLGDQIISAQWIKVFLERLEQEKIDFYAVLCCPNEKMGQYITHGFSHVDLVTDHKFFKKHKFDVLLGVDYFVKFWTYDKGAIYKYAPSLLDAFEQARYRVSKYSVYGNYRYHFQLMDLCLAQGLNRYDLMGSNGLCGFDRFSKPFWQVDLEQVQATLAKFNLQNRPFITLHSGVGDVPLNNLKEGEDPKVVKQRVTRVIPQSLAEEILKLLKLSLPDVTLVQIGEPEGIKFDGADLCLIGQTSLYESLDLLCAASVHIDNDSGLVHVRHAMGKRSVVLWGPTAGDFVGYPEDENLQGNCHACMWLTEDWNTQCPKGYECARCMSEHSAADVVERVKKLFNSSSI